jgi:hypothetical protein
VADPDIENALLGQDKQEGEPAGEYVLEGQIVHDDEVVLNTP